MKIKEEDLLKLGYKKYPEQGKVNGTITSIKTLYQKEFDEDKGIYLNCTHQIVCSYNEVVFDGWNFEIQINPKEYGTINIQSVQWFNFGGRDDKENCSIEKFEELCRRLIDFLM